MKGASHHLRRMDEVVIHSWTLAGLESACPMRFRQLTPETGLVAGDAGEREEAILEVTGQKGTVLQVLDRLALGVQQPLYSLDDSIAMGQKQLKKFDVRVKRHLVRTLRRMNRFAHVKAEARLKRPAVFVSLRCAASE